MLSSKSKPILFAAIGTFSLLVLCHIETSHMFVSAQEPLPASELEIEKAAEQAFQQHAKPFLAKYCIRCHDAEKMTSGVRVDQLTANPTDRQLFLLQSIEKELDDEAMPPLEEVQPVAVEIQYFKEWIDQVTKVARLRNTQKNGLIRRLTVSQYRNTLKDLLGLQEDLTDVLPPDGISKDGFTNEGQTLLLSPLQVEAYFDIAEKALNSCIVEEANKPVIQNFRMDFGKAINQQPCPDNLILGADSLLLHNADFEVKELQPNKPFAYRPFAMRTAYDFIEGYIGNGTIREWRKFDSIYHSVFACMRGTHGYPKGDPWQVVSDGLLLRPALASSEIFGMSSTYGPMANFKISLRELPEEGNFRITVKAARYEDGLLLESGIPANQSPHGKTIAAAEMSAALPAKVAITEPGIYQIDVSHLPGNRRDPCQVTIGSKTLSGQLFESLSDQPESLAKNGPDFKRTSFALVRLPQGEISVWGSLGDGKRFQAITLSKISDDSELAHQFENFEKREVSLGVFMGLRRDCGSTLAQVGETQPVNSSEARDFVFEGAIRDFPSPEVEKDNVNYLAGFKEIGVRSVPTDGRDIPRLLVKSIEFEGPYYESWPPMTHRKLFIDSPRKNQPEVYAREIIKSFATRAFRRPATESEIQSCFQVWETRFKASNHFQSSIKDSLLVVLTSPQFLFLIENSDGPELENLDQYELASKLSYFLWNTSPDGRLLELASHHKLYDSLDIEMQRLMADPKFGQFTQEFSSQWLSLDKFDVVATDIRKYSKLSRDTKQQLRREPVEFFKYCVEQNLPLVTLIQSDFIMANDVVASYYNLADKTESGFRFTPVKHETTNLGGVLTQAGILAGLSDGKESNPIKRGAWLARKIIAQPPDDPPPNVPQLKEESGGTRTLREKLEIHRNQKGCAKCHSGIDPWGIPFESFDAGGLFKSVRNQETQSTLPDGTKIEDLNGLKSYLTEVQIDQVAFSMLKHLATYACGRRLNYHELAYIQEQGSTLKKAGYKMQDLIAFVIKSDLFLKK